MGKVKKASNTDLVTIYEFLDSCQYSGSKITPNYKGVTMTVPPGRYETRSSFVETDNRPNHVLQTIACLPLIGIKCPRCPAIGCS